LALKIHLGAAVGVSSLCFLIWHFVTPGDPSVSVWWWIFPAFFFATTLALHHHFAAFRYMEGTITAVIILNVMLFFTYVITRSQFPWWIYPPIVSAMVLGPIYFKHKAHPTYSDNFNLLWLEYWLLSALLFFTWASIPLGHPWFFYPVIVLAVPLIMYRVWTHYKERRVPVLVGIPLGFANLLMFIGWGFSPIGWPWFLIPLAVSGGVMGLLVWRFPSHSTHDVIPDATQWQQAPTPTQPEYGYPDAEPGFQQPAYVHTPTAYPGPQTVVYGAPAPQAYPSAYPAPSAYTQPQ